MKSDQKHELESSATPVQSYESLEDCIETAQGVVRIDWDRTNQVLGALCHAYNENLFPYNLDSTRVPQDHRHLPESLELGSKDHAMFLFTTCYYMRGGIKSVDAVKRLAHIYDSRPDIFDTNIAQNTNPEEICDILKENGLGFQKTVSGQWVENAKRLQQNWNGDPRALFEGVKSYEHCLERIQNNGKEGEKRKGFIGFQEKMVSMITYYLMDEGLIEEFQFPLPIDLHVLRVSVANELIVFERYAKDANLYSNETLQLMRRLYHRYALDNGISTLRLCDAVWLLSESICGLQPGNTTIEPNGRANRNGRSTVLEPLEINTSDPKQLRAYDRSCARCPVEQSCDWNVPGKIYYVQGELKRRGKRIKFPNLPQGILFDWMDY